MNHQMSTTNNDAENEAQERLLRRPALARDLAQPTRQTLDEAPAEQESEPHVETQDNNPQYLHPDAIVASLKKRPIGQKPGLLDRWRAKGGAFGYIAAAIAFVIKFAAPALFLIGKLKFFLIAGGSMIVSMWAYSVAFGWPMAIGIVLLIFIHECGHALAARLRGIPTGIMVFVPFMGAFVTTNRSGQNLEEDAFIGIMGPIVGSAAAAIACSFYFIDHNRFWLVLGQLGFFINLFNLLPTPPLDGGWIAPLFSPKLLAIGCVIAFVAGFSNPLIWLLLFMSGPRIIAGWKADPKTQPYYQVSASAKWKYGIAYFGLAALLAIFGALAHLVLVA
jgi:Zn-dependent protease